MLLEHIKMYDICKVLANSVTVLTYFTSLIYSYVDMSTVYHQKCYIFKAVDFHLYSYGICLLLC